MDKTKPFESPDELFEDTLTQADPDFTAREMRLLVSGVSALRGTAAQKTLSTIEANALRALMDYVAYTQKADKEVVRGLFLSHFGLYTLEFLPAELYDQAVRFLVDMQVTRHLN